MDEINRIRTIIDFISQDAERKAKAFGTTFSSIFKEQNKVITATSRATEKGFETQTRVMEDHRQRFKMYYLSIMFGAMQMQRTLGRVFADWKKDYFTMTENTTALGQATLRLQGAMTFLSVSIMTALEPVLVPLIETIINLVNWFTSLPPVVQQVAGMFVIGGIFIAGLLFAGAQIVLFTSGISSWLTAMGLISPVAGAAGASLTGLGASMLGFLGPLALLVAAAIALRMAYESNFLGIKDIIDAFANYVKPVGVSIKAFLDSIRNSIIVLASTWIDRLNVMKDALFDWKNTLMGWIDAMIQRIQNLIDAFARLDVIQTIQSRVGNIGAAVGKVLGSKQAGGFIPETGAYLLHRGENVVPKGGTNISFGDISISPVIQIEKVSSPADENELAKKVSDRILADIQNYTKYVGHF
jgi:hypothetical protein